MTRLIETDIEAINDNLKAYDETLIQMTGHSLLGIACSTWGLDEKTLKTAIKKTTVSCIPITAGLGTITGFSHTVAGILRHLGFRSSVTRHPDVNGLFETFKNQTDMAMMADDHRFVAIHLKKQLVVDNGDATGKGFAAALDLMAGGLKNQGVLVLGCGPVGLSAARALVKAGARVAIHDIDEERMQIAVKTVNAKTGKMIRVETLTKETMGHYRCILDATPAKDLISRGDIQPDTLISAPGVPHGLTQDAFKNAGSQFLHDKLEIGVATMAVGCLNDVTAIG